ncbi:MAG: leucine-rich repeat domain-containing protein [Oscillospiraceae bacterium]|nr:leucine-rich repeat domain-containing protein [Oscillospiraceae bacterium]
MAEKLTQEQKKETLENAVMYKSAAEAGEICKSLEKILFSARALGIACRFKGIDYVKALVENGADFAMNYNKVKTDMYYWRTDFAAALFDINEVLRESNAVTTDDPVFSDSFKLPETGEKLTVLPREERLKIAEYLLDNAEKCMLNTDNFLMNCIFINDKEFIDLCHKKGVKFSEEYAAMLTVGNKKLTIEWSDFADRLFDLSDEEFYAVITNLRRECNGELILFSDMVRIMLQPHLNNVDFFRFVLDNFNRTKMNQKAIIEDIIDNDAIPCLPVVEELGWLKMPRKRDAFIQYASDEGKTEAVAWLMDFKNRTADFAAEREKAEKKMQRELNAAPDSVTELKKIWSYKKQDDGTLAITNYKGSNLELTVPEKIGKDTVTAIGSGGLGAFGGRKTDAVFQMLKKITKITLPSTIQSIGKEAFKGDMRLLEVNIPDGVTEIGESTFNDCQEIKSIRLPDSVQKIGNRAFEGCCKLKQINLPQGIAEIPEGAFSMCESLKTVEIPDSVRIIGKSAFSKCTKLEQIVIADGAEEIKQKAFDSCPNLKTVVIPASIKKISVYRSAAFPPSGLNSQELAKLKLSEYPPITIFRYSSNVTVIVEPKSCAERYCKKYGIPYKYNEI